MTSLTLVETLHKSYYKQVVWVMQFKSASVTSGKVFFPLPWLERKKKFLSLPSTLSTKIKVGGGVERLLSDFHLIVLLKFFSPQKWFIYDLTVKNRAVIVRIVWISVFVVFCSFDRTADHSKNFFKKLTAYLLFLLPSLT